MIAETFFSSSTTFMDYLHGDVNSGEARLACLYECARESKNLWKAASRRDELVTAGWSYDEAAARAYDEITLECGAPLTSFTLEARAILACESFPTKDWNELSRPEREKIMVHERRQIEPLSLLILHHWPYPKEEFPQFNDLVERTRPVVKDWRQGEPPPQSENTEAMIPKAGPAYYCLFLVDFSESVNRLCDRFVMWLKQDKIESRLQVHCRRGPSKNASALRPAKVRQWQGSVHWCLFEMNLSAGKSELAGQFKAWLATRKIRAALKRYKQDQRGSSDQRKNHLKNLATWRLYRENGNNYDRANEFANIHRKRFSSWREINKTCKKVKGQWPYKLHDPRPFRDAQSIREYLANGAPLFSHDEDYRHAKINTLNLLADLIPSEFRKGRDSAGELAAKLLRPSKKARFPRKKRRFPSR